MKSKGKLSRTIVSSAVLKLILCFLLRCPVFMYSKCVTAVDGDRTEWSVLCISVLQTFRIEALKVFYTSAVILVSL